MKIPFPVVSRNMGRMEDVWETNCEGLSHTKGWQWGEPNPYA